MLRDVLIVSSNEQDLSRLADQLRDVEDLKVTSLRLTEAMNGNLRAAFAATDLAIICCRDRQATLLAAVDALPDAQRPLIVVCGELNSAEATRLMVRIGVADLLSSTPTTEELQATISRVLRGIAAQTDDRRDTLTLSILGAAGGVGASFLACSLAHLAAAEAKKNVMLVDLDLAYSPMAGMLGLRPTRGFAEALGQLDTLDAVALEGYATRHDSGLRLLSGTLDGPLPRPLTAAEFAKLLSLARGRHELVVVAANRWLDAATTEALVESQHVLTVVAQSLADVRNAVRLRSLLVDSLGVPQGVLRVIVNRYSGRSPIQLSMINEALRVSSSFTVPEDAPLVRHSIDTGSPIATVDRHALVTRALIDMENQLAGTSIEPGRKPFKRIFEALSRSDR